MKLLEVKSVDVFWSAANRHKFGFFIEANIPDEEIQKENENCIITKKLIVIFDDLKEVAENSPSSLRKSAMAKMTPLERNEFGYDS